MNFSYGRGAKRVFGMAVAAFAAAGAIGFEARADNLDLICTGNSYKDKNPFPTVETVTLKTDGKKPVMIGLPGSDKPTKASIVSSNAIQLRFAASGMTGEYFNFTGDLFLIHKDGRLTRLTCKPS